MRIKQLDGKKEKRSSLEKKANKNLEEQKYEMKMFHVKRCWVKRKPGRSLAIYVSHETSHFLYCKVFNLDVFINIVLQHAFYALFEGDFRVHAAGASAC